MIVSNGRSGCGPLEPATFCAQPVPAQQTAMRSAPSLWARATASSTCASSRTSQATKSASSSSPSARPFSALTSAIVTVAPRAISARTVASPRPDAPPTTIAAVPSIRIDGGSLPGHAREREREELLGIGQPVRELEARGGGIRAQPIGAELRADLRPQLLARIEAYI